MKKIAFVLTILAATTASAQTPGPAPTFMHVRSTVPEKGHATLVSFIPIPKQVQVVERVIVDGKAFERTKIITQYAFEPYETTYDLGGARVITPDGKQLPIDEVWKRLKANVVVAVASDSNTPSQPYLSSLNNNTLVIIPAPRKIIVPTPKKEAK